MWHVQGCRPFLFCPLSQNCHLEVIDSLQTVSESVWILRLTKQVECLQSCILNYNEGCVWVWMCSHAYTHKCVPMHKYLCTCVSVFCLVFTSLTIWYSHSRQECTFSAFCHRSVKPQLPYIPFNFTKCSRTVINSSSHLFSAIPGMIVACDRIQSSFSGLVYIWQISGL